MEAYPTNLYEVRGAKVKVNAPLAMVYAPMQKFVNLHSAAKGYPIGTIFKDLDLPFQGGKEK